MQTILIADDEMIERMVLEKRLKHYLGDNVRIISASNGREVLTAYEREHPQLLILDIEMPGISGLDAAEQIRKQDDDCSIIFLTAFEDFGYARRAVKVRAVDYLLKPCDDHELTASVEEAFHEYEERAARRNKRTGENIPADAGNDIPAAPSDSNPADSIQIAEPAQNRSAENIRDADTPAGMQNVRTRRTTFSRKGFAASSGMTAAGVLSAADRIAGAEEAFSGTTDTGAAGQDKGEAAETQAEKQLTGESAFRPAEIEETASQPVTAAQQREQAKETQHQKILQYLKDHYREDISIQDIAGTFGYADPYFCKIFKQYFGKSFVAYLMDYRIQEARKLLKNPEYTVSSVGKAVGYPDPNYFTKVFKRIVGETPSEYRVRHLGESS